MLLWKVKAFIIARIYTKHWFQNIVLPKVAHTIQSGSWPWDIRPEWRKRKPWIPKRWCLDSAPFTPFSLPTTNTSVESTGLSVASEALSPARVLVAREIFLKPRSGVPLTIIRKTRGDLSSRTSPVCPCQTGPNSYFHAVTHPTLLKDIQVLSGVCARVSSSSACAPRTARTHSSV